MKLADLPADERRRRLCGDGLRLRTGPFVTRVRTCAT